MAVTDTTFTKEDVKEFWNRNVCQTEHLTDTEWGSKAFFEKVENVRYKHHFYLKPLFQWMGQQKPSGKLLEVGCGMGTDSIQLAREGFDVHGVDLTENAIDLAQKRFSLYEQKGSFQVGDAENLPFDDDTFDIVYSFGVLHHTPDTQKSIDEVYRVLKPGGLAVIMLYNTASFNYVIHRILNAPFDGNWKDRCPIERSYYKSDIKKMFNSFDTLSIDVEYFMTTGFGIVWDMIPKPIHSFLGKKVGWHFVIKATK